MSLFGLAMLAVIGHAPCVSAEESPPALLPRTSESRDSAPAPTANREGDLEARLREMERTNRELAARLDAAQTRHDQQLKALLEQISNLGKKVEAGGGGTSGSTDANANANSGGGGPGGGGAGTPGTRDSPVPGYGVSGSRAEKKSPLKANFGPGFELMTEDGEFQFQFHQEVQFDARAFDPTGDDFARSGFVFPRVRSFFNGRVTRPVEYTVSLNRGFGGLDVLDAFLNFRYDDRAQLKVGRFMTPFNYEQFAIQNMWLFAPERSLFTSNLGLNRQLGVQLWGTLLDNRVDYALGAFDGPRNSYEDFNEAKDVMAYLNARPFGKREEGTPLRNLNLGGSFSYGDQDNPLVPRAFRTASNASNASTADLYSPPFLAFKDGVRERGQRTFWSAHAAYFYRRFSLFTDYNGGILRYAVDRKALASVDVPADGYSIAMGYFLTGETQERRTILEPRRPFRLGPGEFGPGAWELIFRYSTIELDRDVFTGGLADPALWSRRAWITNLGVNWYLNRYVKVYLDWQHTEFGDPVIFRRQPDQKSLTNELFWLRMQLYF